jgi:hypothetical protein
MLSTAAFGGLGAAAMMSPNPGMYAATSAGGSMIQQVLGMKEKSDAKRAKLSQEEELVMFKMVRDTCDRLVDSFRDYKKHFSSLNRATADLADLKGMVAEARSAQDAPKQLEMEYTLRKQQRDIDGVASDVRRQRLTLIDLAGEDAVDKLDKQLVDEQNKVNEGTTIAQDTGPPTDDSTAPQGDAPVNSDEQAKTADNANAKSEEVPIDQSSNEKQEAKQPTNEKQEQNQQTASNPSPQS